MARLVISILAALGGLTVSLLLSARHAELAGFAAMCGDGSGCETVLNSRWSRVWNIPLAYLGVVYYAAAAALAIQAVATGGREMRRAVLVLAVAGVVVSAAFVGIQLLLIRAVCPLCMTSAACSVALLFGAAGDRQRRPRPRVAGGLFALLVPVLAITLLAMIAKGRSGRQVLATIDGVPITIDDWRRDEPDALPEAEMALYDAKRRYVETKLRSMAINHEANRLGVPREVLIRREVDDKVEPHRAEVQALGERFEPTDAAHRAEWVETEMAARRAARMAAWADELLAKHHTQWRFHPPAGRRVNVDLSLAHRSGPAEARLQLVVFSDLQCPVCAEFDAMLARLRARFGDDLAVYYRHFPLRDHALAEDAAVVAEGISKAGKDFEQYKQALYAHAGELTPQRIEAAAIRAGMTAEEVKTSLASTELRERVRRSAAEARALQIRGAPTAVLNGRIASARTEQEWEETLERALGGK